MLIGFCGLAIDWGYVYYSAHQLQNACDASAHAAARLVKSDLALVYEEAKFVASQNTVAGEPLVLEDDDIIVGYFDKETGVFTPSTGDERNAVRVDGKRIAGHGAGSIPLFFAQAFGVQGANVTRTATAILTGARGAGLIALAEQGCGITMTGNSSVTVENGSIQINSQGGGPNGCGLCTINAAHTINAPNVDTDGSEVCSSQYDGPVNTSAGPIPDPLGCPPEGCAVDGPIYCCLPAPPNGVTQIVPEGSPVTLQPGYYPDGIHVQNKTVNMLPGIYVVGGPGLTVHAGGVLNGDGVMIYLESIDGTAQQPSPGASLQVTANATVNLSPPDKNVHVFDNVDLYHHVTIYQGRYNNAQSSLWAGGSVDISGLIYMPGNNLALGGGPGGQGANVIIAHSYTLSGNASIAVDYDGSFAAPDDRVYLVD